jgi:hypothetical protein
MAMKAMTPYPVKKVMTACVAVPVAIPYMAAPATTSLT